MMMATCFVIASATGIIFMSIPCMRNRISKKFLTLCRDSESNSEGRESNSEDSSILEQTAISNPLDDHQLQEKTSDPRTNTNGRRQKRTRRFSKYNTKDGREYFVPEDGGASVWSLPAGAAVVESPVFQATAEANVENKNNKKSNVRAKRSRRFSRFATGGGKEYFVPEDGGTSVWSLPAGATVV